MSDWKNLKELLPENFNAKKSMIRTGNAGLFAASLELVKEGNILIKQDKLYEDIFIKEK